jgi:predicted GIY-YIG superfamily endonuclease
MSTNIYILELENGRFYVGKSESPFERFKEHLAGCGSAWTQRYKPLRILKIIPNASPYEEDRHVKEYMHKYGIQNVRGGAYVRLELSKIEIELLTKEIWSSQDLCLKCGKPGHFATNCDYLYTSGDESDYDDVTKQYLSQEFISIDKCFECGRPGHYAVDCKAKYEYRQDVVASFYCFHCGRSGHYASNCKEKSKYRQDKNPFYCFHCGRSGHYASNCKEKSKYRQDKNPFYCFKCGRPGHYASNCKENKEYDPVNNSICCSKCGGPGHFAVNCAVGQTVDSNEELSSNESDADSGKSDMENVINQGNSSTRKCFKCGYFCHFSSNCNGKIIYSQGVNSSCCFKCGRPGHFASNCTFNDVFSDGSDSENMDYQYLSQEYVYVDVQRFNNRRPRHYTDRFDEQNSFEDDSDYSY